MADGPTEPTTPSAVQDGESVGWRWQILSVLVLINLCAVVGNVTVIATIVRSARMRSSYNNLFVVHLCVVDLLGACCLVPVMEAVFVLNAWPFGDAFCQFHAFLSNALIGASILSTCVISIDRYYTLRAPMHYAVNVTNERIAAVIFLLWSVTIAVALVPLFGVNPYAFQPQKLQCSYTWADESAGNAFVIVACCVLFAAPGYVQLAMYSVLYCVAQRAARQTFPVPDAARNGRGHAADVQQRRMYVRSKMRAARTVFSINVAFLALWGPRFCLDLYTAVHGPRPDMQLPYTVAAWTGYLAFAVDPLIYGLLNAAIRQEVRRSFSARYALLKSSLWRDRRVSASTDALGTAASEQDASRSRPDTVASEARASSSRQQVMVVVEQARAGDVITVAPTKKVSFIVPDGDSTTVVSMRRATVFTVHAAMSGSDEGQPASQSGDALSNDLDGVLY